MTRTTRVATAAVIGAVGVLLPATAWAHCDTLNGPVVAAARLALEREEVTPTLRWVRPQEEGAIRSAFESALAVRRLGPEARELADRYFFETLVRIHRQGEGTPYTGLKPAESAPPAIAMADRALETGSVEQLLTALGEEVREGIRQRYDRVVNARKHAEESVAAGREYVEAYVSFIHYVEGLEGSGHHGDGR